MADDPMDLQLHPAVRADLARRIAEQGFALLPVEPTREMEIEGSKALLRALKADNGNTNDLAAQCWRAMVNAVVYGSEGTFRWKLATEQQPTRGQLVELGRVSKSGGDVEVLYEVYWYPDGANWNLKGMYWRPKT